jgi:hypothetical protein
MNDKEIEEKEYIDFSYINGELMLGPNIPAKILVFWIPTLILLNIYSLFVSVFFSILIIYIYKFGYNIKDIFEIYKYIRRNPKKPLKSDEVKY